MSVSSNTVNSTSANTEPATLEHPVVGPKSTAWYRQQPITSYLILALVLLLAFLAMYMYSDDTINDRPSPQLNTESTEQSNPAP